MRELEEIDVVVQGIKMKLEKRITSAEKVFLDKIKKKGFLLTYYQAEDVEKNTGGCLKDFKVTLKNNSIKL